ncbi:hypothetical protein [Flavobacterium kingsejongi]|uniref:DUF4381 domain-containing protein n=1 Tax=Flavobacterium kingsejongi TaxID=1678728 RepID=A0A2S1LKZ3_9FLAO|nr:hypothetical protein [Flavobacterium kingsejongi]AWG24443.1 hypothetical protein FK004_03945 [Flavobacterium kingsejongi]
MTKSKFYIIVFLLVSAISFGQHTIETKIDSTKIRIGAQVNLTLKTTVDSKAKVQFPEAKNFGALEVLESYPVDTVKNDAQYELVKRYGLTQFDSGRYVVPKLQVLINNKPFFTDSLLVEVTNIKVDTLKQKMYDIKPIIEVKAPPAAIWWYILALLILGAIGYGIFLLLKKRKEKKEAEIFKTPIEKATTLLTSLESKELWQHGEVKTYYSELTDIARNYIEEAIEIPAMESTTSELIVALRAAAVKKKMTLTQETLESLEKVLKQADLVKFAKSKPIDFEIADDSNRIGKVIVTLDKSIPKPTEEELLQDVRNEELRLKKEKEKQRKRTIRLAVLGSVVAIAAVFGYFVATKGFTSVKDTLLMNSSKSLLESQWIKSEYGIPSVIVATPKVLKRIDNKILPKETFATIKEMQQFAYGTLMDKFSITVFTASYKQEGEINLNTTLEGNLKLWEKQGAQNILVKQEEYKTPEGIEGLKAYGTMSVLNPETKKSHRAFYELLLFKQDKGLQQITVIHEEGDNYADQITKRILNSVEFKKVNP